MTSGEKPERESSKKRHQGRKNLGKMLTLICFVVVLLFCQPSRISLALLLPFLSKTHLICSSKKKEKRTRGVVLVSKIFKMLFLLLLFFLLYNSSWLWTGAFSSFSSCLLRGPRRASPVFFFEVV